MEKNTLLAVILSVVVITGFYLVQGIFFPPQPVAPPPAQSQGTVTELSGSGGDAPDISAPGTAPEVIDPGAVAPEAAATEAAEAAPQREERITIETDLIRVVLSSAGGDIVSYQLKEHAEQDRFVEMVLPGDKESHAFTLAFGDMNVKPVQSFFKVRQTSPYTVEFAREFALSGGEGRFAVVKKYEFKPREYMFDLTVTLNGSGAVKAFNFNGAAYTLCYGPQMGPSFQKLDQRYEYRKYFTYTNGKLRTEKVTEREPLVLRGSGASWFAVAGKYFTVIAVPSLPQCDLAFSAQPVPGYQGAASRMFITRPAVNVSRAEDLYRFYLGPKTQDALIRFNNGKNAFGLQEMQLVEVANSKGFLAPLEWLLKILLQLFQKITGNYGISIILLTLLVKIAMFPLTKKQSESTLKMQALAPKMKEIQDKYKDNPQKMNLEMGAFYKKEGYNPMSGCLPMLIQIPIFFAMYNLFNNHFDLRGALFIPGWIPDLSVPESVYHFAGFRIPILGWTDIRLLPFIYVGSQLLYGKVTQTQTPGQNNAQMKMMLYAMPIIFFFILYDVPSGLLLYWIMSNLLTLAQQIAINKYLEKRKAGMAAEAPPVIIPKKRRRR